MLLYTDALFLEHETGSHPEHAGRLRAVHEELTTSGLMTRCQPGQTRPATTAELERIHPPEYIQQIRETAETGGGRLDPDTVCSPRSYEVARWAAGTACAAVDDVLNGKARQALALLRPPGHHALRDRAMGFCLFANIAIAAAHARVQHGLDRLLIVDWDVHHGNGTEAIFYDVSHTSFLSIHRSPFYPGTGARDDRGTGEGLGYNWNIPLPFGTSRLDFLQEFQRTLATAAEKARPQLVLISAGFDAHRLDPIGSLGLETEDFIQLTRAVQEVAAVHAAGRIVSLLEGGYHLQALAESVRVHAETLLTN